MLVVHALLMVSLIVPLEGWHGSSEEWVLIPPRWIIWLLVGRIEQPFGLEEVARLPLEGLLLKFRGWLISYLICGPWDNLGGWPWWRLRS